MRGQTSNTNLNAGIDSFVFFTKPKFLRLTLDKLLTFGPHIQSISTKAAARCRVLASLTSKKWEWRNDQLMKVYKVLHMSLLTYAAPAWQPWAALPASSSWSVAKTKP